VFFHDKKTSSERGSLGFYEKNAEVGITEPLIPKRVLSFMTQRLSTEKTSEFASKATRLNAKIDTCSKEILAKRSSTVRECAAKR